MVRGASNPLARPSILRRIWSYIWKHIASISIFSMMGAITTTVAFWDTVICERFPRLAGMVPFATCKVKFVNNPGNHTQPPYTSIEHAFGIRPISFSNDLTVSIKKIRTDVGGVFSLFVCPRSSSRMTRIGEGTYAVGPEDFQFAERFPYELGVFILNIEPHERDTATIVESWNLGNGVRIKGPSLIPGSINCGDIKGQF